MNNSIHILLVEDNEGDILLTREALAAGKMLSHLSVVTDGESAIKFLNREAPYENEACPQLILLDINLPRLDGKEVLGHIKTNELLKQIPVVMLTTSSSPTDILEAYHKQANCYITKPTDLNKFEDVIHSFEDFWISIVQLPPCR
jgi:chemotaxis family two-component system response regulator Rcp1